MGNQERFVVGNVPTEAKCNYILIECENQKTGTSVGSDRRVLTLLISK